jgi:hypothetical protein
MQRAALGLCYCVAFALTDRLLDDGLQLTPDLFHDFALPLTQERLLFAELALLLAQLALLRTEHTLMRTEIRLRHGEVGRQFAGGCLNLCQMRLYLRQGVAVDLRCEFVQVRVLDRVLQFRHVAFEFRRVDFRRVHLGRRKSTLLRSQRGLLDGQRSFSLLLFHDRAIEIASKSNHATYIGAVA